MSIGDLPLTAMGESRISELRAEDLRTADLCAEVDRLHRFIRRQWTAVATADVAQARSGEAVTLVSPAAQARAVLGQARESARRLVHDARPVPRTDRLLV